MNSYQSLRQTTPPQKISEAKKKTFTEEIASNIHIKRCLFSLLFHSAFPHLRLHSVVIFRYVGIDCFASIGK